MTIRSVSHPMRRFLWIPFFMLVGATLAQVDLSAGMEAYQRGDYAAALQHWRPDAENGAPAAQFNVGLLYAKGLGTDTDLAEAARWYTLAAEQNFAQAQYNLARLYETGKGVPQDLTLAFVWFKLAETNKYADARKRRKGVAKAMTPHEVAQGDLMVRQWLRMRQPGETAGKTASN